MQDGRECTARAIAFEGPDRIPLCTAIDRDNPDNIALGDLVARLFPSDILIATNADPGFVPSEPGMDQWGCVWSSLGFTLGEVVRHPLASWDSFEEWRARVPDFGTPGRYEAARAMRRAHPDRYITGGLGFLMMDLINLRGYAEWMTDVHLERDRLERLIDILYAAAIRSIEGYAAAGMDAVIAWEDWGLQDRLMIAPEAWRELFKDRMAAMVARIHALGMRYILHSCGYILDIIDDLVEIGVDVLQLDQQRAMGLQRLGHRYRGTVCFFNPADIQFMSGNRDLPAITRYCGEMVAALATERGGFMYKTYSQPRAVEIPAESVLEECRAFQRLNPYRTPSP